MGYWCQDCDREFITLNGFHQHMDTAAVHQNRYASSSSSSEDDNRWECEHCVKQFATEQARHQHSYSAAGHPYCRSCKRMFQNEHNLQQHLHSRTHLGSNAIECPWCKEGFVTASGVTVHLESGNCSESGLNRQKINNMIRQMDHNHVITKPLLTMQGYDEDEEAMATERAWNGYRYECYLCPREFGGLRALNQHLNSPAHEQKMYRCPGQGCGREYKALSGLVMHVESESCGVMRFAQVQRQAQNGIQNMVGRMISG